MLSSLRLAPQYSAASVTVDTSDADRTYPVSDASGDAYDSTNPWLCPGPPEDNPPTITVLGVEQKTGTAR